VVVEAAPRRRAALRSHIRRLVTPKFLPTTLLIKVDALRAEVIGNK
jgi:hypothetical protein